MDLRFWDDQTSKNEIVFVPHCTTVEQQRPPEYIFTSLGNILFTRPTTERNFPWGEYWDQTGDVYCLRSTNYQVYL